MASIKDSDLADINSVCVNS